MNYTQSFLSLVTTLCVAGSLQAATLDWDSVSWTQGDTNNTFLNVDGSGIDVSISFTGSTTSTTPRIDTAFGGINSLVQAATDESGFSVTIAFSQAVQNVSFNLLDIDTGGSDRVDVVTFSGGDLPTSITAGATNSVSSNTITGTATASNSTTDGNAAVVFGGPVSSITYTLTDNIASGSDAVGIGLGDISFVAIPEPSTVVSSMVLGLGAVVMMLRRRRRG